MAGNENKPGSKIVLIGLIFPIILVFAIDYSVNGTIPNFGIDQINPRIANSALTAYILASTVLLGNMFFYGESITQWLNFCYDNFSFSRSIRRYFHKSRSNAVRRQWFCKGSNGLQRCPYNSIPFCIDSFSIYCSRVVIFINYSCPIKNIKILFIG